MGGSSQAKLGEKTGVRVFADIVFVLALLFAPWQVILALAVFGTFFFPRFIEVIIIGIVFDLLYAPSGIEPAVFWGTISGIILYGSIEYAKTHLRGY